MRKLQGRISKSPIPDQTKVSPMQGRRRKIYEQTSGTKRPLGESRALEGLVGIGVMHLQAYHWLDYDAVALAVLVIGISAVTLLALSI
jgi:hypothetical protein